MVLDTSAIIATITNEQDSSRFRSAMLGAESLLMSSVAVLETRSRVVVAGRLSAASPESEIKAVRGTARIRQDRPAAIHGSRYRHITVPSIHPVCPGSMTCGYPLRSFQAQSKFWVMIGLRSLRCSDRGGSQILERPENHKSLLWTECAAFAPNRLMRCSSDGWKDPCGKGDRKRSPAPWISGIGVRAARFSERARCEAG